MALPYREPSRAQYAFTQQDLNKHVGDFDPGFDGGDLRMPDGDGWELMATHVVPAWESERSYSVPRLVAVWRRG